MSETKQEIAAEILMALIDSNKDFFSPFKTEEEKNIEKITKAYKKIYDAVASVRQSE